LISIPVINASRAGTDCFICSGCNDGKGPQPAVDVDPDAPWGTWLSALSIPRKRFQGHLVLFHAVVMFHGVIVLHIVVLFHVVFLPPVFLAFLFLFFFAFVHLILFHVARSI